MITFAGFMIGILLLGVGFSMIWRRRFFQNSFGDLATLFGYPGKDWLDWAVLGVLLMIIGIVTTFGLFETFLMLTLGRLLNPTIG